MEFGDKDDRSSWFEPLRVNTMLAEARREGAREALDAVLEFKIASTVLNLSGAGLCNYVEKIRARYEEKTSGK